MTRIVNAASAFYNPGVQDLSGAGAVIQTDSYPQNLPLSFIFAQRGPLTDQLVSGAARVTLYGEQTFVEGSPYHNHATIFSNQSNGFGNRQMHVRLVPKDAGPKPTVLVSLDVLHDVVDDYERNVDGSLKLGTDGQPKVIGTIDNGWIVKYVSTFFENAAAAEEFGARKITDGDQIGSDGVTVSRRVPIFDFEHSFIGVDGNNSGFRMFGMTEDNTMALPTALINKQRAFPYGFSVVRKNTATGTAKPVSTVLGSQILTFALKPDATDPLTGDPIYADSLLVDAFQNLDDNRYPIQYGEFGRMHFYQENIDQLLADFHASEKLLLQPWHDFTDSEDDIYLFNLLSGETTNGSPYRSVIFSDTSQSIRFSPSTNHYANGGSDGTMNDETFAALVSEYMERYIDPNDPVQNMAVHAESTLWDSGFPLSTKYDLLKFSALRKDTFTLLSTHTIGNPKLEPAQELSIAISLLARASLYPESTEFSTPNYRFSIDSGSGRIRGSKLKMRVPTLYEFNGMVAQFAGNDSGNWVRTRDFSIYPNNVLTQLTDLSLPYISPQTGTRFWDAGLNWATSIDRGIVLYPAHRTGYPDDTSILTSVKTAFVFITLTKILNRVQLEMSGRDDLTNLQFSREVNERILGYAKGRFDANTLIVPEAQFTSLDQRRNYSWTVPCSVGRPGMKTVQTGWLIARRIEDMAA